VLLLLGVTFLAIYLSEDGLTEILEAVYDVTCTTDRGSSGNNG
jgi:hypothetical protein